VTRDDKRSAAHAGDQPARVPEMRAALGRRHPAARRAGRTAAGVILAAALAATLLPSASACASDAMSFGSTYISIIIDDLGNNRDAGDRVARLQGPVACAILPHTPYAVRIAGQAHRYHKEVLLHLPMEAVSGQEPGPGALDSAMSQTLLTLTLADDLASVPYVVGVNNHMGSLLTSRALPMQWVMQELSRHGDLFFVDSRTSAQSVAARAATKDHIPNLSRNVFLDDQPTIYAVERQFALLIRVARERGSAIAIGHPHPATLAVLQQWLPMLGFYRIRLVPLSAQLALNRRDAPTWRASLSPL